LFLNVVKPFLIGDGLTNIVVKKGQIIKYDIKYGGEPDPEVAWEMDGKPIQLDGEKYVNFEIIQSLCYNSYLST